MCYYINTFTDWGCGYRQGTGRHRAECNRATCRLSGRHRVDDHDCQLECTELQMEDQHIIMETRRERCGECQETGREAHPQPVTNGANGHTVYRHLTY
ncbi:hypothetical protein C2E23DRAFT_721155 [Lenzites betulinus]|nr:hypothetical protein C2E23DRAFT_721155 [Lenzites betulinus]